MARLISQHDYHRFGTSDAQHQFDAVETTISHLLRYPHPALEGRSYGEALADRLLEERPGAPRRVVEIGGGTGAMAEAVWGRLCQRHPEQRERLRYTIVDLAPRLQAAQVLRLDGAAGLTFASGDATHMPLRDGALDGWLICNEVIADLEVVDFARAPSSEDDALDLVCRELVDRYQLQLHGEGTQEVLGLGAVRMIEEVARVLAPGAVAFISEFGGTEPARGVELTDAEGEFGHTEFSIRFDHLQRVAEALGLRARWAPVLELLGMRPDLRVANFNDVSQARVLVPRLEVFAYPADEFLGKVGNLAVCFKFSLPRIGDAGFPDDNTRPFATTFQGLLLHRP